MSRFLNKKYRGLAAYEPGEQPQDKAYIKLNTNESPFPPSDGVLDALSRDAAARLNLYPDPECGELRSALAAQYGVRPENVFVSNGSDDILSFSFMAFCGGDTEVVFPDITYGFYKVYAEFYGAAYREIPLTEELAVRASDYYGLQKNVVLANPNAPTGLTISLKEVEEICRTNPDHIVLIDEAYMDFGGESSVRLTGQYENLITVMTYSKSRSLAGARLGFAIADEALIADLNRMKYSTNPYSINRLTLRAGTAAIRDQAYYDANCAKIAEIRERAKQELKRQGFFCTDSKSNFLFAKHPAVSGETLYRELKEKGILVRHFTKDRIKEFIRITVGTEAQMEALYAVLRRILSEKTGGTTR